ncbi:MAG TPA: NPCBM/NEW2 domain-containing protein [Anaerohalosphaeraceae bacterium]|nr:NPCBM/NEW2 domain-containing protein [Anaerohalosphaeraceae bacterium]HOL89138.1 NPCBM/NEW2 domain-containing protein [Anaerohalosphaeraceae bacterium]HPP56329.1 NPCBM/NEW2 domain-containing protein [Anaerohalosphaeraceae bacterium]
MGRLRETQLICEWILKYRDGNMSSSELQQFHSLLRNNPEVRRYYIEIVVMQSIFEGRKSPLIETPAADEDHSLTLELWEALAAEERSAEPVEIIRAHAEPEKNELSIRSSSVSKTPNTSALVALVTAAAAVLLVVFTIHYFSAVREKTAVAVLMDSLDAVWGDSLLREKGTPFPIDSEPLFLKEGYVQVAFHNGASFTIQSPASFQFLGEDMLKMNYGRVYAVVPPSAYGFQICTQDSKIIDLGTEFGIEQRLNGDTEVHVHKGKVVFVSKAGGRQINLNLTAGAARRLIAATGQTKEVECRGDLFVRHIDSSLKWIWKGQPLDLADVVGGGSGFGGGQIRQGIDLASGRIQTYANQGYDIPAAVGFRPVREMAFVDGVFVPNGEFGPTVISSEGHQFLFPKTSGAYWSDITPNPFIAKKNPQGGEVKYVSTLLEIEESAEGKIPSRLLVHPNAGITFDLDKIRQSYPAFDLKTFRAICGIPAVLDFRNRSEFWVLLDGQCVFHAQADYQNLHSRLIEISISSQNRFLTLAATDGGDGTHYDWCVFAQPVLHIERTM